MFDLVHKHKRIIQVLLILLAITFVTWGVESYTSMLQSRDTVATVNGIEISRREFEEELRRQQDRMRQLFGPNVDAEALDTPEMRRMLLDSMIGQRLVASEAARANLTVTDEMLRDTILSIPAFQEGGQFSRSAYETALRQANPPRTPAQFEAELRYELALAQLARAVGEAAIAPRTLAERLASIEAQQREVSQARVAARDFLPQVKIDEAKIKAYYEANQADFRTPERVRAQYVALSAEALAAQETVTPEEVRKHWEAQYAPAVRAKEEARKKAEAIAAEVKKNPASFAEVAKRESQDPGSKDSGGDLGFAARGSFVKPYEDTVFRMREGGISGVVESEFGFHIIQLTGIRRTDGKEERRSSHILIPAPADAKPFEAVKDEIEAELRKQRTARRFNEAADAFQNMVYEQSESLAPVAERFNLKIETTDWLTRSRAGEAPSPVQHPKVIAALFSSDSLQHKRNTDAIEVAPGTLVAARVLEHEPERQRSFEEVKDEIAELLRRREAAALAKKEGGEALEKLRQGAQAGLKWTASQTVSRRDTEAVPREALRPVLSADVSKLPAYVGQPLDNGDYLIVRISKVIQPDIKQQAGETVSRTANLLGAAQYDAFLASLRSRADIEVNQAALERR